MNRGNGEVLRTIMQIESAGPLPYLKSWDNESGRDTDWHERSYCNTITDSFCEERTLGKGSTRFDQR
jgi:hypothetical protein